MILLLLLTRCRKEEYVILNVKEVRIGNLIDEKLKVKLASTIMDSASYYKVYATLDTIQNLINANMHSLFSVYPKKIVVLNDSVYLMIISPNGTIYLSTGLMKSLLTQEELYALICHSYYHVLQKDISGILVSKYGSNAFDDAYFAKDISTMPGAENEVLNESFSAKSEQSADDSCLAILAKTFGGTEAHVLPLAYININFSSEHLTKAFYFTHPNYDHRVVYLMLRTPTLPVDYQRKIDAYDTFLTLLP